ncbi:carbohydrate ABC transporter permease [Mesorhizobium dulcispinae]|uniref:carbohydrate ABC transporter permease n=1 Tax=Mesorhizobium dulcispinae TaxID=3072316 RepID=UPI002A24AE9B|nr:sugar ABC transporter permease [Mesorhizobium sp. VK23D]MDX8521772.1 sugar ABC transporter permease [Mesorhizobium sp. VK23D]
MNTASSITKKHAALSTNNSGITRARRNQKIAETLTAWSLTGPALVLLVALFFLPVAGIFGMALTDWQFGARTLSFVGLDNFREVFFDQGFRASLINTVVYVAIVVPGTIVLGLAIALLIESGKSFQAFYRAIHFLPYMATLTAMAIAWEALLHPTIGLVNQTLVGLGLPTANWLRDENTVLPVLAVIGIWQNLGFAMVLFLAGLKSIPQDLYDAADIDGADLWLDRLRIVTLPMLGPVFMFVFIVVALKAFETFDTVQVLTQGGPGHASELLLFTLYRESFEYLRTGYGAAVAVVFLFIVVALTLIQARFMDKRVHYQ